MTSSLIFLPDLIEIAIFVVYYIAFHFHYFEIFVLISKIFSFHPSIISSSFIEL